MVIRAIRITSIARMTKVTGLVIATPVFHFF